MKWTKHHVYVTDYYVNSDFAKRLSRYELACFLILFCALSLYIYIKPVFIFIWKSFIAVPDVEVLDFTKEYRIQVLCLNSFEHIYFLYWAYSALTHVHNYGHIYINMLLYLCMCLCIGENRDIFHKCLKNIYILISSYARTYSKTNVYTCTPSSFMFTLTSTEFAVYVMS